ncbi:hypothetical protein NC997_24060 [Trichocoleus sp. DQ-A2]|nr:hypothetical protein [Coleofasciculus sp. FACHB-T130]
MGDRHSEPHPCPSPFTGRGSIFPLSVHGEGLGVRFRTASNKELRLFEMARVICSLGAVSSEVPRKWENETNGA